MNLPVHDFNLLAANSWLSLENFFNRSLMEALLQELHQHQLSGRLNRAGTGKLAETVSSGFRGDSTLWLDDIQCGDASKKFLDALHALRTGLNESLFLGLESVEAHYAIYPPGASYSRHRDRFRDDDTRMLSLVSYLNVDWPQHAGGELRMHFANGPKDIAPRMGTTVIFLSEEVEHEVLPATQTRYSIAAWFRRREMHVR